MENKKSMNKVHVKINDIDSTSQGLSEKERARKREKEGEEGKRTSDREQGSHLARIGTRTWNESSR